MEEVSFFEKAKRGSRAARDGSRSRGHEKRNTKSIIIIRLYGPTNNNHACVILSSSCPRPVLSAGRHTAPRAACVRRVEEASAGRARCYAARCPSPRRSPRCPTRWHGGRVLWVRGHGAAALLATADTSRRSRRGRGRRARPLEGDASASRRSRRSVRVRRGARSQELSRALPATTTQGARRLIRARRRPRRRRWTTPRPGPAAW